MGIFTRSHNPHRQGKVVATTSTQTTYTRKPTLMQRLKGEKSHTINRSAPRVKKTKVARTNGTARANGTTRNGVPRRKTSLGDKVSGMMLKVKGDVTRRPGEKAAGTRRMHGTDGRGSRRVY